MSNFIDTYTLEHALADGVLISINKEICNKFGLITPVYFTSRFWAETVNKETHEFDVKNRNNIEYVLHEFRISLAVDVSDFSTMDYTFFVKFDNDIKERRIHCKSFVSENDINDPSPAIFFMCKSED